jgi:ADP-ribose pyrophosphatase YjhB (NUDIX family)
MAPKTDEYRDEHGKRLEDYPRPSVAVDTAVLTVDDGRLAVLLAAGALPGTFIHEGETLGDAVLRSLRDKAGVTGRRPRQLRVFDKPDRDPRGWVLSVAHVDVMPRVEVEPALAHDGVRLAPADDAAVLKALPYEQGEIVQVAVASVRADYRVDPDPAALLDEPFTLAQLRTLHAQVLGEEPMRDTFRRYMESRLLGTGEMTDGTRGRPSRLWRRKGQLEKKTKA